jgi:hypothetical protein
MKTQPASLQKEYARQRAHLARLGWISQGYVQNRGPGAVGPCFQWTRKVKGKTVSVALSEEQYQTLQAAIVNWKEVQAILHQMQTLSRALIFGTLPHPPRRKRLGKKSFRAYLSAIRPSGAAYSGPCRRPPCRS